MFRFTRGGMGANVRGLSMSFSILTVDDAKGLRLMVAKALLPFACHAREATNGFNAFFAIERERPDLILLDINMPVMDGLEALTRIKRTPEIAAIPVIMLASPADHAVLVDLQARGASGLLTKPFTEEALLREIALVLPLRKKTEVMDVTGG